MRWNVRLLTTPLIALFAPLLLAACAGAPIAHPLPPVPSEAPPQARPSPPFAPQAVQQADFVLVDKSDRVLLLLRDGRVIRSYRDIQLGDAPEGHKRFQGDERTPEGRYVIDYRNPRSSYHLSLHISYPDADDRAFARAQGRSPGGDIFIHGQPNGLEAGRRMAGDWTDGCIALSNAQIEEMWRLVPDGTPIEIRP